MRRILPRARGRLEYYVCGPRGLLTGSLAALDQLGVPPGRIHSEQFGWTGPLPTQVPTRSTSDVISPADRLPTHPSIPIPRVEERSGSTRSS